MLYGLEIILQGFTLAFNSIFISSFELHCKCTKDKLDFPIYSVNKN